MMRTPVLHLGDGSALMMLRVLSVSRRVQRDEVGAGEQLVELDLFDAEFFGALLRQERIEGDDMHLQADGARRRRSSRCCRSR
jgi:hypothetical protein